MPWSARSPTLVLLLAAALFEPAAGQLRGPPPGGHRDGVRDAPRGFLGGGPWFAEPEGRFGRAVDAGWGGDLNGRYELDDRGVLSLRGDLGFLVYGHERQTVCFDPPVGCRIALDLTTSNTIFLGGLGPEIALPGRRFRPYAYGGIGFAYFSTRSSLSGADEHDDFASTENFGDGTLAWRAGGGLQLRLTGGRNPIWLDLGAEHHRNGVVEYLTEGDIQDHPDGSITLFPRRTEADLTTFRIGVSVGLGRDPEPQPR